MSPAGAGHEDAGRCVHPPAALAQAVQAHQGAVLKPALVSPCKPGRCLASARQCARQLPCSPLCICGTSQNTAVFQPLVCGEERKWELHAVTASSWDSPERTVNPCLLYFPAGPDQRHGGDAPRVRLRPQGRRLSPVSSPVAQTAAQRNTQFLPQEPTAVLHWDGAVAGVSALVTAACVQCYWRHRLPASQTLAQSSCASICTPKHGHMVAALDMHHEAQMLTTQGGHPEARTQD